MRDGDDFGTLGVPRMGRGCGNGLASLGQNSSFLVEQSLALPEQIREWLGAFDDSLNLMSSENEETWRIASSNTLGCVCGNAVYRDEDTASMHTLASHFALKVVQWFGTDSALDPLSFNKIRVTI